MRIPSVAVLILIGCVVAHVSAQDITPPPGFAPGFSSDGAYGTSPSPLPPLDSSTRQFDATSPTPAPIQSSGGDLNYLSRRGRQVVGPYPSPRVPSIESRSTIIEGPSLAEFPNVWLTAESLLWWSKSSPVPIPLVTDGGAIGTGSSVLLGNQTTSIPGQAGGRFTLGAGLGAERIWALEGSYFFLRSAGSYQGDTADGSPASSPLAFPYFNPNSGETSSPINLPGSFAGTAVLSTQSALQGADVNLLRNLTGGDIFRFDLLGGFRYVNLQENLTFSTNSPNVFPNTPGFFNTFDSYDTQNNFYGGQIGGRASLDNGIVFFNATGKMALGVTNESVLINGGTSTDIGGFASSPGGYLTHAGFAGYPGNIGTQSVSRFAVVPELNLNFGVYLRPWARLMFGYSFLYASSVARPGDQMSHTINGTQTSAISNSFPPTPSGISVPSPTIQSTSFWAQGLSLGIEFRF